MKTAFYYFSPTGGTEKVGRAFVQAFCSGNSQVVDVNLLKRDAVLDQDECEAIVVAVPVFAGRVASLAAEKLKQLDAKEKKAVALVVYGVRAYEDALIELADILEEAGAQVVAAGAFIAQHSMLASVGAGRPDEKDLEEIKGFAEKVAAKIETGVDTPVAVPGNRPYKDGMVVAHTPISNEGCMACSACEKICPTEAISIVDGMVETELAKCMDCLACIAACPLKVRTLKPAHQAGINERLGGLVDAYPENEMFL